MADSRLAALTVLEKCRRAGAWSDAVLGSVMDAQGLQGKDRGLTAALCYGVMQNRMLLDHVIARCATMPLQRIEPKVLDILRLAAFQIIKLDRVPAAAAVDSAVKQCKQLGFQRAAGFVNAVLRRISEGAYQVPEGNNAEALSIRYSHPLWFVQRMLELLGAEETEKLLRADNAPAPITIQTNALKTDTAALLGALSAQGLVAEAHPFVPDCIALRSGSVRAIPEFQRGDFYVQDAAAKLSVLAASPGKGQRILDVCAAPGGKSFAAAIISGGAEITACDLHEKKLSRIQDSAKRLGITSITTRAMDARARCEDFVGQFDLVIADVPCSGLGVIRKKPDIRYKVPEDLAGLPAVQRAILQNVSAYVKPGGTLLYSTCTVLPEENSGVCTAFLKENPGFVPVEFTLPDGSASQNGMLQLWPQRQGTDGFFIAKMRKCREST
jgi:16S rRNA (cytosine967-C5)-methyltransferase